MKIISLIKELRLRYKNAFSNLVNFGTSTLNRLIVYNVIIAFYGSSELGSIGEIFALNSLSVAVGSFLELRISSIGLGLLRFWVFLTAFNVLGVSALSFYFFQLDFTYVLPLICIQALTNTNLIFSGQFFHYDKFQVYRQICIKGELFELIVFLGAIFLSNEAIISYLFAIFMKNSIIALLAYQEISGISNYNIKFDQSKTRNITTSSISDIVGSIFIASVLPLIISQAYGKSVLGAFMFYRQFFSIGTMIQTSVFRGLWRDVEGSDVGAIKLLKNRFLWIILISNGIVWVLLSASFPLEAFEICSIAIFSVNISISRNNLLFNGHINKQRIFNGEIVTVIVVAMLISLFEQNLEFYEVLGLSVFVSALISNVIWRFK